MGAGNNNDGNNDDNRASGSGGGDGGGSHARNRVLTLTASAIEAIEEKIKRGNYRDVVETPTPVTRRRSASSAEGGGEAGWGPEATWYVGHGVFGR